MFELFIIVKSFITLAPLILQIQASSEGVEWSAEWVDECPFLYIDLTFPLDTVNDICKNY